MHNLAGKIFPPLSIFLLRCQSARNDPSASVSISAGPTDPSEDFLFGLHPVLDGFTSGLPDCSQSS
jgi:hypothetical protein